MPPTAMTAILNALNDVGPMTAAEMRTFFDKKQSALHGPLQNLHKIKRLIYITDYQRNWRGRAAPIYALGTHHDAIEQPLTPAERDKRYRARFNKLIKARSKKSKLTLWEGLMK